MTSPNLSPHSDGLDRTLTAYFQAQMPNPWPAPPVLVDVRPAARPARGNRTRITLAASVAALFVLAMWLTTGGSGNPGVKPGGLLEKGTADGTGLKKMMDRPMNK